MASMAIRGSDLLHYYTESMNLDTPLITIVIYIYTYTCSYKKSKLQKRLSFYGYIALSTECILIKRESIMLKNQGKQCTALGRV